MFPHSLLLFYQSVLKFAQSTDRGLPYSQLIWIPWTNEILQWRHNGRDGVLNYQSHHCLLNRLFWRGWKKARKIRVTGLCAGNSMVTGEFPAQMASNAENASIWWRHHEFARFQLRVYMMYCNNLQSAAKFVSNNGLVQVALSLHDASEEGSKS